MIFFTTIIFIAELIIAIALINAIIKLSRRVNDINSKLLISRYKVVEILEIFKKSVRDFSNGIENSKRIFIKKRNKLIFDTLKALTISVLFIVMSKKYKKQIILFELLLILYDTYKEGCVT